MKESFIAKRRIGIYQPDQREKALAIKQLKYLDTILLLLKLYSEE